MSINKEKIIDSIHNLFENNDEFVEYEIVELDFKQENILDVYVSDEQQVEDNVAYRRAQLANKIEELGYLVKIQPLKVTDEDLNKYPTKRAFIISLYIFEDN